jgi:hypothetical protein
MKIGEYIKKYTSGDRIFFKDVLAECVEFFAEVKKFNKRGMKEEFGDIFHFFQLWLFWDFGVDGEIWRFTKSSVDKFIDRKAVWRKIYEFVSLDKNVSNFCGNYEKIEKVVKHLSEFGIGKEKAEEAYRRVVGKTEN